MPKVSYCSVFVDDQDKAVRFYQSHGFVDAGPSDDLCRHAGITETARRMERRRS